MKIRVLANGFVCGEQQRSRENEWINGGCNKVHNVLNVNDVLPDQNQYIRMNAEGVLRFRYSQSHVLSLSLSTFRPKQTKPASKATSG